jgi:ATP-binding cassette subfamily B protein
MDRKINPGTWKKLHAYTRKLMPALITAIICAALGSALTLAGPSRLSEITDTITEGMTPDTEELQTILETSGENTKENFTVFSEAVQSEVTANTQTVTAQIQTNLTSSDLTAKAAAALSSDSLSDSDKAALQNALQAMAADPSSASNYLLALPASVQDVLVDEITFNGQTLSGSEQCSLLNALMQVQDGESTELPEVLYSEITVNDVTISAADQIEAVGLLQDVDTEDTDALADVLRELPDSVKDAVYTDITVDGTEISGEDQQKTMELLADVDTSSTSAVLDALDALPSSVKDKIEPVMNMKKIIRLAEGLAILYAIGWVLSALQGWIMTTITQKLAQKMRKDISEKINRLPMRYFHTHSTGDTLSRVTNDVDTLSMSLNMSIGTLVSAVTLFIGSLILMIKTNLLMTAGGVAATIIGFFLMMFIMGHSQKYFQRQQSALGDLDGQIEEIYSGHMVVKAYNGEDKEEKHFDHLNEELRTSAFKAQSLSGLMQPLMTFIGNFGYVVVCVIGALLVMNDRITFGVIVSFMLYIRYFTQPLSQMAQAVQSLQSAGAASSRVFAFLDEEEMEDESQKTARLENVRGDVSFEHVHFGYNPDKTIIHDFNAEVKAGQKVALVGPTGAGKTTMVNLLMRFYETDSGIIRIDGTPTRDVPRENVHEQFCMVLQDTWVFEGTVRENLVYCCENVPDEKVKRACEAVGLDHFISTLPKGYDTMLDSTVSLSAGQKQQITIARAMIADKPILILDEATSSIDTRTELQIQKAMDQLMKGRTSFVIAHRLSTIRDADLILVIRDGDIVEKGTHEELLAQNGFYASLYNSQFEEA